MSSISIIETQDGSHSLFSEQYSVSYHSKYGAIQESRHVFLEAGLLCQMPGRAELSVLEIGLGTGLNALLSLLEAEKHQVQLAYEAVEGYPISPEQAATLNYPQMLGGGQEAAFMEIHRSDWGVVHQLSPHFAFRKEKRLFEELDYENQFDVIYFDAFAPSAQPELWEEAVLGKMYAALKPQGVLVTYCAKGVVKRRLKALGFIVEALKGPPGKREMTRARKVVD